MSRFVKGIIDHFCLSNDEWKLIDLLREANKNKENRWIHLNILWPFLLIGGTLILFNLNSYLKSPIWHEFSFSSIVMNGSLSIIGFNVLLGMISFIENKSIDETKGEEELEEFSKVNKTRRIILEKVNDWAILCLILSGALYVIQVLYIPTIINFYSFHRISIILLLFVFLTTYLSLKVGSILYILKDEQIAEYFDYAANLSGKRKGMINSAKHNPSGEFKL